MQTIITRALSLLATPRFAYSIHRTQNKSLQWLHWRHISRQAINWTKIIKRRQATRNLCHYAFLGGRSSADPLHPKRDERESGIHCIVIKGLKYCIRLFENNTIRECVSLGFRPIRWLRSGVDERWRSCRWIGSADPGMRIGKGNGSIDTLRFKDGWVLHGGEDAF